MKIDILTIDDLKKFKEDIISDVAKLIEQNQPKKWLRSSEVRELLNISPVTLQNMRINGLLPFSRIGTTIYYDYDDIQRILNRNKSA